VVLLVLMPSFDLGSVDLQISKSFHFSYDCDAYMHLHVDFLGLSLFHLSN